MLRDNSRGAPGERDGTLGKKCADEWLELLIADIRDGDHDLETLARVSLESLAEELGFRRAYLCFIACGLPAAGIMEANSILMSAHPGFASRMRARDWSPGST